ncbi:MAG: 30S ribosomal protein S6 [Deltaproteobacteria bacterium]|nr:30S ribosomal protein S6 [Deltaproteobacteria bacterium]
MKEKNSLTLYETIFIVRPDRGEEVKEFTDKFKKIIQDLGAEVTEVEEWGLRELAYPIRKQRKGYYVLMRHRATRGTVDELERHIKLNEGILRYLTVRLDEELDDPSTRASKDSTQEAGGGSGTEMTEAGSGPQGVFER